MLYLQQSLGPDEELIHVGHFHWIYNVQAMMNIIWGVIACVAVIVGGIYFQQHFGHGFRSVGWLAQVREVHPGVRLGAFFVFLMGLLGFARMMITKATTEIAITNNRLIYKRGLVARVVGEMSIDRIEGVNVLQSVWGRIFGYGRVMVRGMGVGELILPPMENPIAFRKAIERARVS
ncbi:MAG: PH domain-containing protein [Alphaproteobacteria bacterium]|nr:PH domain-containing protein [Alphaproteobacteria bacterium]